MRYDSVSATRDARLSSPYRSIAGGRRLSTPIRFSRSRLGVTDWAYLSGEDESRRRRRQRPAGDAAVFDPAANALAPRRTERSSCVSSGAVPGSTAGGGSAAASRLAANNTAANMARRGVFVIGNSSFAGLFAERFGVAPCLYRIDEVQGACKDRPRHAAVPARAALRVGAAHGRWQRSPLQHKAARKSPCPFNGRVLQPHIGVVS